MAKISGALLAENAIQPTIQSLDASACSDLLAAMKSGDPRAEHTALARLSDEDITAAAGGDFQAAMRVRNRLPEWQMETGDTSVELRRPDREPVIVTGQSSARRILAACLCAAVKETGA